MSLHFAEILKKKKKKNASKILSKSSKVDLGLVPATLDRQIKRPGSRKGAGEMAGQSITYSIALYHVCMGHLVGQKKLCVSIYIYSAS